MCCGMLHHLLRQWTPEATPADTRHLRGSEQAEPVHDSFLPFGDTLLYTPCRVEVLGSDRHQAVVGFKGLLKPLAADRS